MIRLAHSVSKRIRPHWGRLLGLIWVCYLALLLMMYFGSNDVANNLFFLFAGIAVIAFAFLSLAGLFALAGHPDRAWRPAKKLLVGLTIVVLAVWVICIITLFVVCILHLLRII